MMTLDEKYELICKVQDAEAKGNFEDAEKFQKMIPIRPGLAMSLKEVYGGEYLKLSDLNLSEAEEVYGKDWLEK